MLVFLTVYTSCKRKMAGEIRFGGVVSGVVGKSLYSRLMDCTSIRLLFSRGAKEICASVEKSKMWLARWCAVCKVVVCGVQGVIIHMTPHSPSGMAGERE